MYAFLLLDYIRIYPDPLFMQLNVQLDLAPILDQFVRYSCAKDESDQFCAVSQLNNFNDVCTQLTDYVFNTGTTHILLLPLCSFRL